MGGVKNTFKKFLTNKTTVTLVGILLGLGVLVGFYLYRVSKEVNPTRIPVAKRDIAATEEITKDDIEYIKVRKNSIYPGDKIDLWLKTTDNGLLVFGEFISNIEVLAVRDSSGQNVFDVTSGRKPAWLLFAVKTDMYRYLKFAENISGMVVLPIPKNNLVNPDIGSTQYSSQELIALIDSQVQRMGA